MTCDSFAVSGASASSRTSVPRSPAPRPSVPSAPSFKLPTSARAPRSSTPVGKRRTRPVTVKGSAGIRTGGVAPAASEEPPEGGEVGPARLDGDVEPRDVGERAERAVDRDAVRAHLGGEAVDPIPTAIDAETTRDHERIGRSFMGTPHAERSVRADPWTRHSSDVPSGVVGGARAPAGGPGQAADVGFDAVELVPNGIHPHVTRDVESLGGKAAESDERSRLREIASRDPHPSVGSHKPGHRNETSAHAEGVVAQPSGDSVELEGRAASRHAASYLEGFGGEIDSRDPKQGRGVGARAVGRQVEVGERGGLARYKYRGMERRAVHTHLDRGNSADPSALPQEPSTDPERSLG